MVLKDNLQQNVNGNICTSAMKLIQMVQIKSSHMLTWFNIIHSKIWECIIT